MRDTAGSAAAPAARSRNCRRGSFMDGPFRNAGDTPPSTGEESGRICRIVCDCACRRHQCCQLFRTRNAAHSRFMSSSWASRAPCLYAHRIALENYAPALVDGNPASNSRNWLRECAAHVTATTPLGVWAPFAAERLIARSYSSSRATEWGEHGLCQLCL
jgi:hypothetical protein